MDEYYIEFYNSSGIKIRTTNLQHVFDTIARFGQTPSEWKMRVVFAIDNYSPEITVEEFFKNIGGRLVGDPDALL